MAELEPRDLDEAQKAVRSQTKKGYFIVLGVIFAILLIFLITSWSGITDLYRGFLRPEGRIAEEEEEADYACLGGISEEEYQALSTTDRLTCDAEIISTNIESALEGLNCEELNQLFNSLTEYKLLMPENPGINDAILLTYEKFQEEDCTFDPDFSISNYTESEIQNFADYCTYNSFYLDQSSYTELVENPLPDFPENPACFPLIFAEEAEAGQSALYQVFIDRFEEAGLDLTDCEILQIINNNENNKFRLVNKTQERIQTRIEEYCQCPGGPAYERDPVTGECVYNCEKGEDLIENDKNSYFLSLQTMEPESERISRITKLYNDITEYKDCFPTNEEIMEEVGTISQQEGYSNEQAQELLVETFRQYNQEKQNLCNDIKAYQYRVGISDQEIEVAEDILSELNCCENPGEAFITQMSMPGQFSTFCAETDEQLGFDIRFYVSIYESALENEPSLQKRQEIQDELIDITGDFNSRFSVNPGIISFVENKDTVCSSLETVLNLATNAEEIEIGSEEENMLKLLSKNLECCPPPGHYGLISEVQQGEEPLYGCLAEPEELFELQMEKPECEEIYPEQTNEIFDSIIEGSNFYEAVVNKNSTELVNAINEIQSITQTFGEECKLTTVDGGNLCTITRLTLGKAGYDQADFNQLAKLKLSSLFNDTFNCCYYGFLEGEAGDIVNVIKESASQIKCEEPIYGTPEFTSVSVNPESFNPSEGETVKFQYSVDNKANIDIEILDEDNKTVFETEKLGIFANAVASTLWDGTDNDGDMVDPGEYTFKLTPYNFDTETDEIREGEIETGQITVEGGLVPAPPAEEPAAPAEEPAEPAPEEEIEGYEYEILDINIYNEQDEECYAGMDCYLVADLVKRGEVPTITPDAFIQVDDETIDSPLPIEGLVGSGEISMGYNYPDPIITNALQKQYEVQFTILEGASQLAIQTKTFTITEAPEEMEEEEEEEEELEIINHEADPEEFNPLIYDTKISYEISDDAIIEMSILDDKGVTIVTLIDDEEVDEGTDFAWWNGTDKTEEGGTIVAPGTYNYKIIAKDPDTEEVQDIETGEIEAQYETAAVDFEEVTPEPVVTAVDTTPTTQEAATVSLQEAETGVTAGTGPESLIYLLFPVAGYFVSRKKIKKIRW